MHRYPLAGLLLATIALGCGDDAPVGVPVPCVGRCVSMVQVDLEDLILTPGDTVRLRAHARSADGTDAGVQWMASGDAVTVDSGGLVVAGSVGMGIVVARPLADTAALGVSEIRVVHPDTGGQPFLTAFRDARTGELLPRYRLAGRDSISVTVNYVLGNTTVTEGAPSVLLQVRRTDSALGLRSWTIPLDVRGRAGFTVVTLFIGERDLRGDRLLPPGAYDLYALVRLANGRVLGDLTGYRVQF